MKKCPFCGETKYIEWIRESVEEKPGDYRIKCLSCSTIGPPAETRIKAEELWDNRIR